MSSAPMNILSKWAFVMLFAILCAAGIRAQEISASIRGTVTDGSGGAVNGAKVTAINADTGLQRTAVTNSQGAYVLVELPVGRYRVEAEAQGFKKYIQEGISLDVNQQATVAVHLAVGTATQQIQVTSDAPIMETTSTNLGQTVGEREILDLPLNGRDFTQLGLLQTGVVPLTPGLLEAGGPAREGQAYAVNGQRPESNNFLIDGADNFDTVDGGLVMKPPIDAIAEFRILTHTANAEFGHSTGSTTNIITRSGTNDYHGTVWDFFRNNAMDAKSFFADSVEPLHRNQFGGVFGGPIKKDKTFFFLYYEGVRDTQGETTRATVPSDAERTGNFADQCPLNNGRFNAQGLCIDNSSGQLSQNGQLINEFSGQPIPYNQLPFINPISQTLLSYYPLANSGPFTYVGTQSLSSNTDQFGVRVDHYLTSRDTLNFRYSYGQLSQIDPLPTGGANVPGFPVGENQRDQNFVAQETHTFSPTAVGILRASYLRNKFLLGNNINHTDPASLGFQYEPTLEAAIGPPFIQVGGYASIGDPITGPRNTYQNTYDFSGSLTWVKGRHQYKFGGGYQYDQINVLQGIATNGFFVFSNFPVNNSFASLLFGQPVVFLQGGGNFYRGLRGQAFNLYGAGHLEVDFAPDRELRTKVRSALAVHGDSQLPEFVDSGQAVRGVSQRTGGFAVPRRSRRAARIDSHGPGWVCAAPGIGVGRPRRREVAGDFSVRNLLRSLLHRTGRPVTGPDQRATLFANAAGEHTEFCRSLQRTESIQWNLFPRHDPVGAESSSSLALRAGLELEY